MPTNFALPIGHSLITTPTFNLCIGKDFRQPVDISNDINNENYNGNFSQGIEIWLNDADEDRKIFAMFDGILTYTPAANANEPNVLTLKLEENAKSELKDIPDLLEPMLTTIIYENVDSTKVQSSLISLITTAYTNSNPDDPTGGTWHPLLRMLGTDFPYKNIRVQLSEAVNLNSEIQNIVNEFLTNSQPLLIKAGEEIGSAGTPLNGEAPPATCTTLTNPRRVTIITEEYACNRLNPRYYLWKLLKNAFIDTGRDRHVNCITSVNRNGNTFGHPLLSSTAVPPRLAINMGLTEETLRNPNLTTNPNYNDNTDTLPRVPIRIANIDLILFPVGQLKNFHGYSESQQNSAIEWRINNFGNLNFETQIRQSPATPNTLFERPIGVCTEDATNKIDVCPDTTTSHNTKVQTIWNNYSDDIDDICSILQFPGEYIIASIGQESVATANQRSLALEQFKSRHISACQQAGISQTIINAYVSLAPEYGLIVPSPLVLDNVIKPNATSPGNTLTWRQLLQLLDVSEIVSTYSPNRRVSPAERMSPGLVQTLVTTARERLNALDDIFQNIPDTFGVSSIPNTNSGLFTWLLTARHSILASVAYHKFNYLNFKSALDLPKVGATYNAGSLNRASHLKDPDIDGAISTVTSISNATPRVVTTQNSHGFFSGEKVIISRATPSSFNKEYTITVQSPTTFSLNGTTNNGTITGNNIRATLIPGNPWLLKYNGLDYPRNLARYYNAVKNNATIMPRARFNQNV